MFNGLKLTPVQENVLMKDVVAREHAFIKPRCTFAINPKKPNEYVSDKPNSFPDDKVYEHEQFKKQMADYLRPPNQKYSYPLTASMEHGWIQDVCLYDLKNDPMFNFHKKKLKFG